MFDFYGAFLNGELGDDEEVYMEQPLGYEERDRKRFCVQLLKSIYGLQQALAGRKWYEVVCRLMDDLGFHRSEADPPSSTRIMTDTFSSLPFMLTTAQSLAICRNASTNARTQSKLDFPSDLGLALWLLGIKITQNREARTLGLSQQSYIESILKRFNFTELKPLSTPMDPTIRYSKAQCPQTIEEKATMRKIPYREAVGALMYCAVATRPDIAFLTALLSQFVENPAPAHWEAIKHIFRYLLGTKTLELIYGGTDGGLEGYMDTVGATQEH